MALIDPAQEEAGEPALTPVTVQLDGDAHELLVELMRRTGVDASEMVGWALGAYWRELEGIVLPPPPADDAPRVEYPEGDHRHHFTPYQIASIEAGLADAAAGRTISNEDMFAELRAKYGW